jgi:hypothetical protein
VQDAVDHKMKVILFKEEEGSDSYTEALEGAGHEVAYVPLLQFQSENRDALVEVCCLIPLLYHSIVHKCAHALYLPFFPCRLLRSLGGHSRPWS